MHLSFKICDLNIFKISLNCAATVLIYLTKGRQGCKILLLAMFPDPGKTLLPHKCCCHHPEVSGKSISQMLLSSPRSLREKYLTYLESQLKIAVAIFQEKILLTCTSRKIKTHIYFCQWDEDETGWKMKIFHQKTFRPAFKARDILRERKIYQIF